MLDTWVSFTSGWDERGLVEVACVRRRPWKDFQPVSDHDASVTPTCDRHNRERKDLENRGVGLHTFIHSCRAARKQWATLSAVATGNRGYHGNWQLHHTVRYDGRARLHTEKVRRFCSAQPSPFDYPASQGVSTWIHWTVRSQHHTVTGSTRSTCLRSVRGDGRLNNRCDKRGGQKKTKTKEGLVHKNVRG